MGNAIELQPENGPELTPWTVIEAEFGESLNLSRILTDWKSLVILEPYLLSVNDNPEKMSKDDILQKISPWESLCDNDCLIVTVKNFRTGVKLPDPRFGMKIIREPDGPKVIIQRNNYFLESLQNADKNQKRTTLSSLGFSMSYLFAQSMGPDTIEITQGEQTEFDEIHHFDEAHDQIRVSIQSGTVMNFYNEYESLVPRRRRALSVEFETIDNALWMKLSRGMEPDEIRELTTKMGVKDGIYLTPHGVREWDEHMKELSNQKRIEEENRERLKALREMESLSTRAAHFDIYVRKT